MPRGDYQDTEGFVTLAEAGRRLGVAKATVQRMAQDGRLATYRDPRDRRVRLARVDDIERLSQPVPADGVAMIARDDVRKMVDAIPDDRLPAAQEALASLVDPFLLALASAPIEDEVLSTDELADLEQAEAELAAGTMKYVTHDEVGRRIRG